MNHVTKIAKIHFIISDIQIFIRVTLKKFNIFSIFPPIQLNAAADKPQPLSGHLDSLKDTYSS